jgi:hypothetical protein
MSGTGSSAAVLLRSGVSERFGLPFVPGPGLVGPVPPFVPEGTGGSSTAEQLVVVFCFVSDRPFARYGKHCESEGSSWQPLWISNKYRSWAVRIGLPSRTC